MPTPTNKKAEQVEMFTDRSELIKHISELVIKEFSDFTRYLKHDIQLERLYEVRTREYWLKVEQRLTEELKSNGRTDTAGTDAGI